MKAILNIINNGEITINPYTYEVDGNNLAQSVGFALREAHMKLHDNKQWDNPIVSINGITLTSTEVKKVRKAFIDFQMDFPSVRESILAQLAFTSTEAGVDYIRHTDKNGYFSKQKSFSVEQIAAQAKERLRLTRDLARWRKEDAKASVVPQEVAERRLILAEAARQKRIAAKVSAK